MLPLEGREKVDAPSPVAVEAEGAEFMSFLGTMTG